LLQQSNPIKKSWKHKVHVDENSKCKLSGRGIAVNGIRARIHHGGSPDTRLHHNCTPHVAAVQVLIDSIGNSLEDKFYAGALKVLTERGES
jgi:hypothetical protein